MKLFLAIDDTDNLESQGTGHLAESIGQALEANRWGTRTYITRHQLLVHPDVPYTSHNSSMCFEAEVAAWHLEALTSYAIDVLETESAPGSDPGLCIALAERVAGQQALLDYGRSAKQAVLKKEDAYQLADRLGVHLSEHGGTGGGVIGALAAVGLRLTGSDGRVKGKLLEGRAHEIVTAGALRALPHVEVVRGMGGEVLPDDEPVKLGEKVKAVFLEGRSTLLLVPAAGANSSAAWETCPPEIVKQY